MVILGIDPGYATIGYGAISNENGRNNLISYGSIETSKNSTCARRLQDIETHALSLMQKIKPDVIAVEELFFNTNITTGIKVAQARGVLLLCSIKHCSELFEYTPLQIKSTITGNGNAKKQQVEFMVKALLHLKEAPKPDDAADALAVALCHALTNHYDKRILN